jgi:hypothetical protein
LGSSFPKSPGFARRRVPEFFWDPRASRRKAKALEYTQLTQRLQMLEFLYRALDESRIRTESGLVLEFCNPPAHEEALESYNALPSYDTSPRLTVFATKVDVARELGISGTEAITLLKDLETDECLQLDYASSGPYVDAGEVTVSFTEKGLTALGVLPDPQKTLLEKLEAIEGAVNDLQGVSPEEKKSAIDAVEELKSFVRTLPSESAVELLGKLPSVLGIGSR